MVNINLQKVTRKPGSLWYAHEYDPAPVGARGSAASLCRIPRRRRVLRRHHAGQRHDLPAGPCRGAALPPAAPQRLQRPLPEPAALRRRQQPRDGITLDGNGNPTNAPFVNNATGGTPHWLQIGTEGGFLANPVKVPSNVKMSVPLDSDGNPLPDPTGIQTVAARGAGGAARRHRRLQAATPGRAVILYNDAPAPFPGGDDRNDYFPGWNVGNGVTGVATRPTPSTTASAPTPGSSCGSMWSRRTIRPG